LADSRFNERAILIFLITLLLIIIVFTLRFIVEAGDRQLPSFYRLMIIILLTLLAITVYSFVKS